MNHFKLNFKIGKYHHLLFLSILFGNFWIWRILREDLILGILLLILSFLLFIVVSSKFFMSQQIAIIFLIIIISSLTLKVGFDKNIFITSPEEQLQQNFRHGLYSIELGQLFTNKYGQNYYKYFSGPINKLQRNFFSNLDFNLYFFASHPRERGTGEFEKYYWIFLPFFILGLFLALLFYLRLGLYFIAIAIISTFLSPAYSLGPVLFFPLINVVLALGLIYCIKILRIRINN